MSLDEFIADETQALERFRAMWIDRQAKQGTDAYPKDMPPGDWWEQFSCHDWGLE